jgi:hypothetical protein
VVVVVSDLCSPAAFSFIRYGRSLLLIPLILLIQVICQSDTSCSPNRCIHLLTAPSLQSSNPAALIAQPAVWIRLPRRHLFWPSFGLTQGLACERKMSQVSLRPGIRATFSMNRRILTVMICSTVGSSRCLRLLSHYSALLCNPISSRASRSINKF